MILPLKEYFLRHAFVTLVSLACIFIIIVVGDFSRQIAIENEQFYVLHDMSFYFKKPLG